MRFRFALPALCIALAFSAGSLAAQTWSLKDTGVGLVVMDGEYAEKLKIVGRGDAWDLEPLYAAGAFSGRSDGTRAFAAWIQGPPVAAFLDKNGMALWDYRYKVSFPGGTTYESGLAGFYAPGHAVATLSIGGDREGTWKVEWFIVSRATKESRLVATNVFTTTWGKPAVAVDGWTLKDMGVGLVVMDGEYAEKLKVAERGVAFDLKKLYDEGAFSGRSDGTKAFAAWIQGPPVAAFLDKNGLALWDCRYTVAFPGGKTYESGLAGFYAPGHAVATLFIGGDTNGSWKVDWYLVNRQTKESRHLGASEFTTTWK